jgi:hypothetical protein
MTWTDKDDDLMRELLKGKKLSETTYCPKYGLGSKTDRSLFLARFCTHAYCPIREAKKAQGETL